MKYALQKITKISQQKKNKRRYNIFLNEQYAFSVTEDVLIKNNLYKGLTLTNEQIETLKKEDAWQQAYLLALHYLQYRMRTKLEVKRFLLKEEIPEDVVCEIVDKLEKENYINDLQFAEAFVRDRKNFSTKGPILIEKELVEKGISRENIVVALKQYSDEEQIQLAVKWAEKQLRRKSRHSYRKRIEQLKLSLMQKGYHTGIVQEAVSRVTDERNDDTEMENLVHHAEKLRRKYEKKHHGEELSFKLKAALYRRGFSHDLINEYIAKLDEQL